MSILRVLFSRIVVVVPRIFVSELRMYIYFEHNDNYNDNDDDNVIDNNKNDSSNDNIILNPRSVL